MIKKIVISLITLRMTSEDLGVTVAPYDNLPRTAECNTVKLYKAGEAVVGVLEIQAYLM
jgi:hypothetical protein